MIEKINNWDRQISISIAILTVFAAVLAYLQMTASNLNSQYRAESSRYAIEAMRLRSTGETRSSFEASHVVRLVELVEQQKTLAEGREDAVTVDKLDAVEEALRSLSPVLREPYVALGDGAVAKYETDSYVVDAVHAEQMRTAVTALDSAWDTKANTYVVHLTLIAVVLALLGLAQAMTDLPRVMVLVVSAVMTAVTVGWTVSTYVQPLPVLSRPAIDAFAVGYGAAYRGDSEAALKSYDEAVQQLPTYADAHFERGMVLYSLGRAEDALQAMAAARANEYDAASIDSMESYLLMTLGRHADAEAVAQSWVNREPESRTALGALLLAQAARDQMDAANATMAKLQEIAGASIRKQVEAGAGVDDATVDDLDVTADLLRDVVSASQGNEEEITKVTLSDASRDAVSELSRALRSQAMRAAFGLTTEAKGKAGGFAVGVFDGEQFTEAESVDAETKMLALRMNAEGIGPDSHLLVRFYEDGFENAALRYVSTWQDAGSGDVVIAVPIDIGEAYVLNPGDYELEVYIDGVMQGDRAPFTVAGE